MAVKPTNERYLVIGGSGFLGSYIVQAPVDRREPSEADVVAGVKYFCGDILNKKELLDCLEESAASTVFHTAPSVKSFVFTSSTSVVWADQDVSGLNEDEVTIPEKKYEAYNHTKGIAEAMVLQADGVEDMKVAAFRPPRYRQAMWRLADAYNNGQHKYQIGKNTNFVDLCYVGNVADAHVLAADRLSVAASSPSSPDEVFGQAFFITEGKPGLYWEFPRMVFRQLGDDGKGIVELPRRLCLVLAFFSELWTSIFRGVPRFPRFIAVIATQEQWYNIDKVFLIFMQLVASPH
ncbi:hypothetical protein GALMADRAFT_137297 [Galerina marginata CBS 339.88]|uniref:3-beta hydroxysteroid dehydrogenase/isomerase domain-containing protein n=1 Tax=Galerina marginata (strain CBS 339.88) TaxID=685588 RepID=A0A067TKL0_GALM3|nr:hypothetical protein GALMADRAFT_137297 [Galerina marginata CBS 339.88]